MNPESAPVLSALIPWLFAVLALVFAGLVYLILRLRRLEHGRETLADELGARLESLFGHQQLHFVRELQAASTTASDRVMDMVAGETDRLRERLSRAVSWPPDTPSSSSTWPSSGNSASTRRAPPCVWPSWPAPSPRGRKSCAAR
jgi:hypothetical protein